MKNRALGIAMVYLAIAFIMTGCEGKQKNKVAMGRYVEQTLELPGEFAGIGQKKDGTLMVGTYGEDDSITISSLNEDDSWKEENKVVFPELENIRYLQEIKIEDNGIYYVYDTTEGQVGVGEILFDGTTSNVLLMEGDEPYKSLTRGWYQIEKSEKGDYIISREWSGAVSSFDGKTGKLKNTFCNEALSFMTIGERLLVATGWAEKSINTYDLETGQQIDSTEYNIQEDPNEIYCTSEGTYLFNKQGIQYKSNKGTSWEQIVPEERTKFCEADSGIGQGFALPNEQFVVMFMGNQDMELKKYYFDPNIETRPAKEVTIYMMNDIDLIRQAVAIYQKEHQDVSVNIKTRDRDANYEDTIKSLNTELLAGGGPDFIILDQLPIATYIEKGLLTDVSDMANQYISEGGYRNIVNTYKQGEAVYAIPLRFRVPIICGKRDIVSRAHDLDDLAQYKEQHQDEILFNKNVSELSTQFYDISQPFLIDQEGKYNREKVKSYIEDLECIGEEKETGEIFERIDFEPDKYPELLDVATGKSQLFIIKPRSIWDTAKIQALLKARGDGDISSMEVNGEILYEANVIMGINANSKNQDMVKEIMKIALSDEVQSILNAYGVPTSKRAVELQEELIQNFRDEIKDNSGRSVMISNDVGDIYEKCKGYWEQASLCCNKSSNDAADVAYRIVYQYTNGNKSIDEILDEEEEKMELRAAE